METSGLAARRASTSAIVGMPSEPTERRLRAATALANRPAVMAAPSWPEARMKKAAAKTSPAPVRSTILTSKPARSS